MPSRYLGEAVVGLDGRHRGLQEGAELGVRQRFPLAPGAHEHLGGVGVDVGHLAGGQGDAPLLELLLRVLGRPQHEKEQVGPAQVGEDAVGRERAGNLGEQLAPRGRFGDFFPNHLGEKILEIAP